MHAKANLTQNSCCNTNTTNLTIPTRCMQ